MQHDEIAVCPDIVVLFKVGRLIPRTRGVVPKEDWHAGECCRGDELTGSAVHEGGALDAFAAFYQRIVDGYGDSKSRTLGPADIDRCQRVFLPR
jgi:hypothetical protein